MASSQRIELCFPETGELGEHFKKLCDRIGSFSKLEAETEKFITDLKNIKISTSKLSELVPTLEAARNRLVELRTSLDRQREINLEQQLELTETCENIIKSRLNVALSKSDQQAVDKIQKMYDLFKDSTGIGWDYSSADGIAKGLIMNNDKTYVHSFCYQKDAIEGNVSDCIWGEIANAGTDWSDLE